LLSGRIPEQQTSTTTIADIFITFEPHQGKDTKPEMLVRKFLFSKGLRYRLHDKNLSEKPDLILPKFKTAIFIQGCFWHYYREKQIQGWSQKKKLALVQGDFDTLHKLAQCMNESHCSRHPRLRTDDSS